MLNDKSFYASWRYQATMPDFLCTAEQVRMVDQKVIADGTPGIDLMRRAATAVLHWAILSCAPGSRIIDKADAGKPLLIVFCGSGNNAGDGYLVAELAQQKNLDVLLVEVVAAEKLKGDAALARQLAVAAGVKPVSFAAFDTQHLSELGDRRLILVDALLGTGIVGEPRPGFVEAIACMNRLRDTYRALTIAIDIPSGVNADTGYSASLSNALGDQRCAVYADITVTFIALKCGLFLGKAPEHVGRLTFDDLQVDATQYLSMEDTVQLAAASSVLSAWPVKRPTEHKYSRAAITVIGGDDGMAGAPILSASAAIKLGAGLVKLLTLPSHVSTAIALCPELMVQGLADRGVELGRLIPQQTGVLLIGPGLGQADWGRELLSKAIDYAEANHSILIVDADGLNLLAGEPELLASFRRLQQSIITPHAGEARRLLQALPTPEPDSQQILSEPIQLATYLAEHYATHVVLKGTGTVIAFNKRQAVEDVHTEANESILNLRPVVSHYGNACLATAGSGDTLAGMMAAALSTYGRSSEQVRQAIVSAVVLHAAAADHWRQRNGPHGMTAGDLPSASVSLLNEIYHGLLQN